MRKPKYIQKFDLVHREYKDRLLIPYDKIHVTIIKNKKQNWRYVHRKEDKTYVLELTWQLLHQPWDIFHMVVLH
jgi:hypothetical protein